jgi:hypothetical protein
MGSSFKPEPPPMMRNVALLLVLLVTVSTVGAPSVSAQDAPPRHLSASLGVFSYQLSESGLAPMLAIRGSMPISSVLVLEAGVVGTRSDQVGRSAMFLAPEAQVQIALPFESFVPYMGLGLGAVVDFIGTDAGSSQLSMTVSGSLGIRSWLNERIGIQTEFRGRGIGFDFARSSSEYSLGLAWRM